MFNAAMAGGVMPQQGLLGAAKKPSRMQGLLDNPLLYAGLGLLSNPNGAQGAMQGLGMHQQMQNSKAQRAAQQQVLAQRQKEMELKKKEMEARMAALSRGPRQTAEMRNHQYRQGLSPDEQAQYDSQFARQQNTPAILQEQRWLNDPSRTEAEKENYWRSKRAGQNFDVGGVTRRYGPDGSISDLSTIDEVSENEAQVSSSKSEASALAGQRAKAAGELAGLETQQGQFEKLLNDPSFSGAVGRVDSVTGRVGEFFGTKEGVLGGRAEQMAATMVLEAGQSLSGAMSDGDIALLRDTAPGRGDSEAVWNDWYENMFKPKVATARKKMELGVTSTQQAPDVGTVADGYVFLGGDPSSPDSWQKQ